MRCWVWLLVATVLCQQLAIFPVVAAKKERKRGKDPHQFIDPFNVTLSNSEEVHELDKLAESLGPEKPDPALTWVNFRDRTNDGTYPKKKCKSNKNSRLSGPPGPAGPQGPPGPPGVPGAEVTHEVLLQEFKQILKEATERRSTSGDSADHTSEPPPLVLPINDLYPYRRIDEAFHCRLKGPVLVDKRTLAELQNFQLPTAKGSFLRGSGMNLPTGRFTATIPGIYQFSAHIHIDHSEMKSKGQLRPRDSIRVQICIESLCHRYTRPTEEFTCPPVGQSKPRFIYIDPGEEKIKPSMNHLPIYPRAMFPRSTNAKQLEEVRAQHTNIVRCLAAGLLWHSKSMLIPTDMMLTSLEWRWGGRSLEVIAGLESNSRIFTVHVQGLLQLQSGQYTSIFVDNGAGAPITVQNGSDFMGIFMGL